MDLLPILLLVFLAPVVPAVLLGLRARRSLRAREEHRRASEELTHRQLTELRGQQDEIAAAVRQIEERLARHLEPRLSVLERAARLDALAGELEQGVERGRLGAETAHLLTLEIARLRVDNAATDGAY
ncbi:MAG TPA: hypothetical protein VF017_09310 [Thermoanaerobaculia bacterium]|nr:hypothetical protein [Thermoanaerobaculia bacterium]